MRTPHWIGIVVIALIVGGAFGYVMKPVGSVSPEIQAGDPPIVADRTTETKSKPALPVDEGTESEKQPPAVSTNKSYDRESSVDPEDDLLLRALQSIEPLPAITGDRTITGYVRTPDGDPVAGVRITAIQKQGFSYPGHPEFESAEDPRLWEFLAEHTRIRVRQELYPFRSSPSVQTNEEGYYELAGLAEKNARVRAVIAGYHLKAQGRTYVKPDAQLDWVASRAGSISVTVTGASEDEAGSLRVYFRSAVVEADSQKVKLAEPKSFELGEGTWEVWAEDRQSKLSSDVTTVKVEAETGPIVVQLVLKTPPDIELKVVTEGGQLLGGFRVLAAPFRADLLPEEHFDERRRMTTRLGLVTEDGVYRSAVLDPGEYVLGVQNNGTVLATTRIALGDHRAYSSIKVGVPPAHAGIRCVVKVPAGEKTSRLRFSIYVNETAQVPVQTWEMDDGSFLLVPQREFHADVESISVEAYLQSFGTQYRAASALKGSVVEFTFEAPAELFLKITNVPEGLARDLAINYRLPNGRNSWRNPGSWGRRPKTDEGEILIQAGMVQPGSYEYWIQAGHRNGTPELARTSFVVEAGEDTVVEMRLVDLYEVTLEASGVEVYTWMSLLWEEHPEERGTSLHMDDDGTCIIPYLPAGTYTIKYRVNVSEPREKTFTVKDGMTVYLTE